MKRDLDRIREILIECENSDQKSFVIDRTVSDFDRYQINLMHQAGFVEVTMPRNMPRPGSVQYGLARYVEADRFTVTWNGHDYLDAVRSEGVWQETKKAVAETGGSMTLEIVKSLALGFAKKKISQHTGIEL